MLHLIKAKDDQLCDNQRIKGVTYRINVSKKFCINLFIYSLGL